MEKKFEVKVFSVVYECPVESCDGEMRFMQTMSRCRGPRCKKVHVCGKCGHRERTSGGITKRVSS